MRQTSIVAALVLSVPVCLPPAADEAALLSRQPAWVAQEPVSQPRIFAEGAISTPDDEMDATFTADGKTIYFTKTHFPNRLGVIVSAHFQNGKWSEPEVVSFSGRFTDYDPFITPDGTKLFFASNRPLTGGVKKDFDIWFVEKTPAGWGEAKNAGAVINSPQDEFYPSVATTAPCTSAPLVRTHSAAATSIVHGGRTARLGRPRIWARASTRRRRKSTATSPRTRASSCSPLTAVRTVLGTGISMSASR